MMVNVSGKAKDINKNLLEKNSSCLEKGKILKEITTVLNERKDRKKVAQHTRKNYIVTYVKKDQFVFSN